MTRATAILSVIAILSVSVGCAHEKEASSENAQALVEKGRTAARNGDFHSAAALFTQAIVEDPDLAEAYNERGKSNVKLRLAPGETLDVRLYEQNALDDFSAAVQKNPAFADAYFNRAMVLASRAQYKQAVDDLLNAARYNSSDPEPHRWLGELYEQKFEDRNPIAMEHYEKYLELGGTDAVIRDKVKAWKESRKLTGGPHVPAYKPATPEDEVKAAELHSRAMQLVGQPDKTEALEIIGTLLSTYSNTKYVQERMNALQALLLAFRKKGQPK